MQNTHIHAQTLYTRYRDHINTTHTQRYLTYISYHTHLPGTKHRYRTDYIQNIHKCTSIHRDPIELTNITYTSTSLTYHIYRLYTHNIHAHAIHNRYKTHSKHKDIQTHTTHAPIYHKHMPYTHHTYTHTSCIPQTYMSPLPPLYIYEGRYMCEYVCIYIYIIFHSDNTHTIQPCIPLSISYAQMTHMPYIYM